MNPENGLYNPVDDSAVFEVDLKTVNELLIFMVAEKPQLAESIADKLSNGRYTRRKGIAQHIEKKIFHFD